MVLLLLTHLTVVPHGGTVVHAVDLHVVAKIVLVLRLWLLYVLRLLLLVQRFSRRVAAAREVPLLVGGHEAGLRMQEMGCRRIVNGWWWLRQTLDEEVVLIVHDVHALHPTAVQLFLMAPAEGTVIGAQHPFQPRGHVIPRIIILILLAINRLPSHVDLLRVLLAARYLEVLRQVLSNVCVVRLLERVVIIVIHAHVAW